jgi:hypothetical protein
MGGAEVLELLTLWREVLGRKGAPKLCDERREAGGVVGSHEKAPLSGGQLRCTRWEHHIKSRGGWSDRRVAAFAGANADGFLNGGDEDLAITDFACAGGLKDGSEGGFQLVVSHHHNDLGLG